jgi:hypothetical protein
MNEQDHCDNYIHNHEYPICLRYWLLFNRLPAVDMCVVREAMGEPKCFATWKNKRVRLVMASRFGDVGITTNLDADYGYSSRVSVAELSDFSAEP